MMNAQLLEAASQFGTPAYIYDLDAVLTRTELLRGLFGDRFGISYAIKANPNPALLKAIQPVLSTFDASSLAEVRRAVNAGMTPERITFSGPAKRPAEITGAIDLRIGELVIENIHEARQASDYAVKQGVVQTALVRINPLEVPRRFGASMAGTASQFGIDEECLETDLPIIQSLPGLNLVGFHIYSGSNCLHAEAIAENFAIFAQIFRKAQKITGINPKRLVFGSGFGVPYLPGDAALDHAALPDLVNPIIDDLKSEAEFQDASCNLELGRWLVGPFGWLLTSVISHKQSRGKAVRMCDAGFNNHLAACGMMGSVMPRNWVIENLSNPMGEVSKHTLFGPLCTSIDRLAKDVELPEVRVGDVLSIAASGAYGLTASPTQFISHPYPKEIVIRDGKLVEATEPLQYHSYDRLDREEVE
jgi:diaminopimelate decarboxylase